MPEATTTAAPTPAKKVYAPQAGPQTRLCSSAAQIVIYGGQAGGGKSFGLGLDPIPDMQWSGFRGLFLRRTLSAISESGALWDVLRPMYQEIFGGKARGFPHFEFQARTGAVMKFGQLEDDKDLEKYQGPAYTYLAFDELTQFPENHFWRLAARVRPAHGPPPPYAFLRIRASCNPDPRSWVKRFIQWWLDEDTHTPIPERDGVIRYVCNYQGKTYVEGSPRAIREQVPEAFLDQAGRPLPWQQVCLTATFIRSTLDDNPAMLESNPQYRAFLNALDPVTRRQWLLGSWAPLFGGEFFNRRTFPVVTSFGQVLRTVRYWDLAGSKRRRSDFTAGAKAALLTTGEMVLLDVRNVKARPAEVEALIASTARDDGHACEVWIEEEKGAAGQLLVDNYARTLLQGFYVVPSPVGQTDKELRAKLPSGAAERGHVLVLEGPWNEDAFTQLEQFPGGAHDDMVDAVTGAWHALQQPAEIGYASR